MDAPTPVLWKLSITRLSTMLERGEISAIELLDEYLRRIDAVNPTLNAIVHLDLDGARAAAKASDARTARRARLGRLDGIPLVVKDNIYVRGVPATWGSYLFADHVPREDEIGVVRLRDAGMVLLGKTNTPEFAVQGYTGNLRFGVTRNPWNPTLTPGGSSGGSVVAVACGMAPAALGTDGGGSARRPAGYVGIVGLKASTGRIPRYHGFPLISLDFEVICPVARTVDDLELLYRCMAGPDLRDRSSMLFSRALPVNTATRMKPKRIRYIERVANSPVDPTIVASIGHVAQNLERLGHHVDLGQAPYELDLLDRIYAVIIGTSLAHLLAPYSERLDEVGKPVRALAQAGYSALDYHEVLRAVHKMRAHVGELFENIDLILTPSAAAMPWPAEQVYPPFIADQPVAPRAHAPYTRFVNVVGYPAISLPAGASLDGTPIGFQLIARFGAEDDLLAIASQYESAYPNPNCWPDI